MVSKYILDCKPYDNSIYGTTWEKSYIRNWLNGEFLDAAFSSIEQEIILTTSVRTVKNLNHRILQGKTTKDKIFLLSIDEAYKYFDTDSDRVCKPTVYGISNGVWSDEKGNSCWWLRSVDETHIRALSVRSTGSVRTHGLFTYDKSQGIRPAIWLPL